MKTDVNYPMPEAMANYVFDLLKQAGERADVKELFQAMHHVLAGGRVSVELCEPGDQTKVSQLAAAQLEAFRVANEVNLAAGTYTTAA